MLCIFGAPLQVRSQPPSANLVGTVLGTAASPVPGIEITAKDPAGRSVGQSVTDVQGQYVLKSLPVGQYGLTLDPDHTGYRGATVVASLVREGLTVNWTVSAAAAGQEFFALGSVERIIVALTFVLGPTTAMTLGAAGGFGQHNPSFSQ